MVVLLGVGAEDGPAEAEFLANKVATLRVFADDEGKFNRSLLDSGGAALVVSQFTLYADARKGRRPSFIGAASPDRAEALVGQFVGALRGPDGRRDPQRRPGDDLARHRRAAQGVSVQGPAGRSAVGWAGGCSRL